VIKPKDMIPIRFELMFSHGAQLITAVEPVMEFQDGKSTGRQKIDEATKEPIWSCTVLDNDPETRGPAKSVKVQIISRVQPVPPAPIKVPGTSIEVTPVEFEAMAIRPYCAQVMEGRYKVAYSIFARGIVEPAPADLASIGS
jgi:hypothetical protein